MAITSAGATLTSWQYSQQLAIRASLLGNLQRLWPLFRPGDFATFDGFARLAAVLVRGANQASAQLAGRYLVAFRAVEGQPASIAPVLADPPAEDIVASELRATGFMGTLNAVRAGLPLAAAAANGWVRASGSASSMALAGGRDTIVATVDADPRVSHWQRVTGGDPCAFCAMLAGRGAVYREETVDFQAHDHCACSAEPEYSGSTPPPASERFGRLWEESTAGLSGADALNAFRRSLAGGGGE
jgi:hypothetical protein